MKIESFAIVCVSVLFGAAAPAGEPRPPGIGVALTLVGPVFVDERGMTLYRRSVGGREAFPCPDRAETVRAYEDVVWDPVEEFPMRVPDAAARKSCIDKYPPLIAPDGAQPLGHWTIQQRANGMRQWAYRDRALYRAVKDRTPGDLHGAGVLLQRMRGWEPAAAPLDAPAGIQTRLTALGLALTDARGKTLYQSTNSGAVKSGQPWQPVLAPMIASGVALPAGWSIATRSGGLLQWAWQGQPLYTYVHDSGDAGPRDRSAHRLVSVFGETYAEPLPGWRAVVLKAPSALPQGVRSGWLVANGSAIPLPKIATDGRGHTLYAVSCNEITPDRLDCDDVGDSPRYWSGFCGGERLCREQWRPLSAPRQAAPIDGLWSVSIVNPAHPYRPLAANEAGVAVWAYQGRLVYTYAGDEQPGDTWGLRAVGHLRIDVEPVPAFAAQ